jgi:hypothetical protein
MRLSVLAVPAALLLASNAGAQSRNYPQVDTTSITTVEVTAPFQANDADVESIGGRYALSNGWRLNVEPGNNGIVAQIDRQRPMRLIAVTRDRYVSRDGNVSMDFNRGDNGDEMMMSYVPDRRVAIVYVIKAILAQR